MFLLLWHQQGKFQCRNFDYSTVAFFSLTAVSASAEHKVAKAEQFEGGLKCSLLQLKPGQTWP